MPLATIRFSENRYALPRMCGIAGILRLHPPGSPIPPPLEAIPERWLDQLEASIAHRGPDGRGRFRDRAHRPDGSIADIALVHRRLSILDHAGGAQPMVLPQAEKGIVRASRATGPSWVLYNEPTDPAVLAWSSQAKTTDAISGHRTAVLFNGCIYNHRDLRRELASQGRTFVTDHSDTEVLVHGWQVWRAGMFARLEGMFALVVWDATLGEVMWARDRFGEKPLYRCRIGDGLHAFASTYAGLAQLRSQEQAWRSAGSSRESTLIDTPALRHWIRFGWSASAPFKDSPNASPGHCGSLSEALEMPHPSSLSQSAAASSAHDRLTVASADAMLRQAVHQRLEADVPIGCFLSGGIDSALIMRYASEARADLAAFTVRMPEPGFDESQAAAETARHLGVRHSMLDCDADPARDLLTLIPQLGLPFGDSSLLPSSWVSRATRQAATVALGGDGGDELFLGYDRHRVLKLLARLQKIPGSARQAAASLISAAAGGRSTRSRASRLAQAAAGDGYPDLVAIFPSELARQLLLATTPRHDGTLSAAPRAIVDAPEAWLERARRFDTECYLPEDLLRKSDTASMAAALELRAPFLDRTLAQAALQTPLQTLMPHGERKGLLRAVARRYLPESIVQRPKQGFAIPVGQWFRSDYGGLRQLLHDHLLASEPFGPASLGIEALIDRPFVHRLLREHDDASSNSIWPWKGRDHSQRLYMLLVLSVWAKWLGSCMNGSGKPA